VDHGRPRGLSVLQEAGQRLRRAFLFCLGGVRLMLIHRSAVSRFGRQRIVLCGAGHGR
jgi:hypothetical protein